MSLGNEPLMDMTQYDETATGGQDCVPKGRYNCFVFSHEIKANGAKLGILVKFLIADGPFADKKPQEYFNVRNPSVEAVRIGGENLKKLTIACGLDGNTALTENLIGQWYGKPIVVEFIVEKSRDDRYPEDSNRARAFYHPSAVPMDAEPGQGSAVPQPPAQPPAAAQPAAPAVPQPPAQPPVQPAAAQPAAPAVPQPPAQPPAQPAAPAMPTQQAVWEANGQTPPPPATAAPTAAPSAPAVAQ